MIKFKRRIAMALILSGSVCLEKWISVAVVSGFLTPAPRIRQASSCLEHMSRRDMVARVEGPPAQIYDMESEDPLERKFLSYLLNIQRERKTGQLKAVRSMTNYLGTHHVPENMSRSLVDIFERALTQSFRSTGEAGDYRLILQLVDSAILFSNGQPLLKPRIFGEALAALSQTHANASKIKNVWNLVKTEDVKFLASPLTTFELNVMLKALGSRNSKARACLDIFRQHSDPIFAKEKKLVGISPDSYTATTLISILTDSVRSDQPREDPKIFETLTSCTPSALEKSLRSLTYSSCWQWNAMIDILPFLRNENQWNNFAYSSLLKLQDRAQELAHGHENGPRIVLAIFDAIQKQEIRPDIVTCTLAIKGMSDPHTDPDSWKWAMKLFEQLKADPHLPYPNKYTYSAAILACARCQEYDTALNLLNEMRTTDIGNSAFVPPKPNTWIYNGVLSAIATEVGARNDSKGRFQRHQKKMRSLALSIFQQMKDDHFAVGLDTEPDTVTYNTVLSIKGLTGASDLIQQMKTSSVPRDGITYRNAILASTNTETIQGLLKEAIEDLNPKSSSKNGFCQDLLPTFNAALSTSVVQSNLTTLTGVLKLMGHTNTFSDSETMAYLIKSVASDGKFETLNILLNTLQNKSCDDKKKGEEVAMTLKIPQLHFRATNNDANYFATAIESSLLAGKLGNARSILLTMRELGVQPTSDCLGKFALAYAQAAIRSTGKKSSPVEHPAAAISRAENAYKIATTLKDVSLSVLSKVAYACARTGRWSDSRGALRAIHRQMMETGKPLRQQKANWVRGVHGNLIKECEQQSNITAALAFARDIQNFARISRGVSDEQIANHGHDIREIDISSSLQSLIQYQGHSSYVGMRAADWVSLIKCASDSGHWKVCVNTLQFLKSHVSLTNPSKAKGGESTILEGRHEQLVSALTATCLCLEKRSQYAWGERVLEDWMKWSGRQPRPEAVLATVRNLSERGMGEEVKALLSKCIDVQHPNTRKYTKKGVGYEEMLHIGAITALHNNGMYDDADEVFISAISKNTLPFDFGKSEESGAFILDLHGMNTAMAHSAVRVAMRRLASEKNEETLNRVIRDMMIITGRGRNSALRLRPVIRPEVQRMLLEEFYPPLNTVSVPGNTGALMVYENDISAWQLHQQEQKGARMLTLAALLKNASSDRIKKIATTLERVDP